MGSKVEITLSLQHFFVCLLYSFCAGFSSRILCSSPFPSKPCIRPSSHLFPGNCWPRIYSQSSMHPDLMESSGRDAFGAADAS